MRALGVDPGTRSFDLVVVEEDRVVWEKSIDTVEVANNPEVLIKAIEEAGDVDVIAGPSGYGVPVTRNDEIIDPWKFALRVLLLTTEHDLKVGIEKGEVGIKVYEALAKVVVKLWEKKLPVVYIPSAILLPTIATHRKINKLDMGTADKMAIAVLGVYDQAERLGVDYNDVSFILVEMGFGYNAVLAVDKGRIIDGFGGTLVSTGFLTIGPIDAELAVMAREWSRSDVFHGGVSDACKTLSIDEVLDKHRRGEEPCSSAFEAMLDSLVKAVKALTRTLPKPKEILLSGRYSRHPVLRKMVAEELAEIAPVVQLRGLPGARISKEAAQGYAIVGEGLAGGVFKKLIDHMRINEARGTVLDWVIHPRLVKAKEELRRAYTESVKNPKL